MPNMIKYDGIVNGLDMLSFENSIMKFVCGDELRKKQHWQIKQQVKLMYSCKYYMHNTTQSNENKTKPKKRNL